MARSAAGTRQPKPAVEVDVAGAADSLESQLVLDTHGQTASAPGVPQEPTPSSESPLRAGDVCEVVGGDKQLVEQTLDVSRLHALGRLPRREFFDIPDPRFSVLQSVAERARAVTITVHNSPPRLIDAT